MDLEETRAFLAVLDHGSFKAAAELAKQPRATLRRRVEALEARAGVALLERSHSGVVPTAAGELLARQARAMLRETAALLETIRQLDDEPRGELRVGLPADSPAQTAGILCGLMQDRFPGLRIHLRVCEDPIADLLEHVDVAVAVGSGPTPTRCRSYPLLRVREGLRASRSYLQRHGMPRTIDELLDHQLLARTDAARHQWRLSDGTELGFVPKLTADDPLVLRRLVELGFGIAMLCEIDTRAYAEDHELVAVLEETIGRTVELRVVVPEVLSETAKVRALLSQLDQRVEMGERHRHGGLGMHVGAFM